jgi:hypothetical protein
VVVLTCSVFLRFLLRDLELLNCFEEPVLTYIKENFREFKKHMYIGNSDL